MTDLVLIAGLQVSGIHGVLPEERERPQPFAVDIELSVDLSSPGLSDDLSDTVDYGEISIAVGKIVSEESYFLLERLASRIAEVCRSDERVTRAVVTVRKLKPPISLGPISLGVDYVGVRIER